MAEVREAEALNVRLVQRAIEFSGRCTGEHRVGYGRSKFLRTAHRECAVEVMRLMKAALDPRRIINSGMVLPDEPFPFNGLSRTPDAA